jgi:uncharacterized protein (TIGR03435 family)
MPAIRQIPVFLLAAAVCAKAQTARFEVVSITPNASVAGPSSIRITPGRVSMSNVNVRKVVLNAYGIPDDRQYSLVGPDWLSTDHFDINATFPPETTAEAMREMMRTMLAERFKLSLHQETRQLPMYSLVVAKGGPKIYSVPAGEGKTSGVSGHFVASKITMAKFADLIAREAGLPVADSTGLDGVFDFKLDWSPESGLRIDSVESPAGAEGPSILTALQEQLGLRLERGKGPVEVLVMDRIERTPSAN